MRTVHLRSYPTTIRISPAPSAAELEALVERILAEGVISMTAAARQLGSLRDGRPVHPGTLVRWHERGQRRPDGRQVHLEAIRWCGRLVTSRPAVVRFLAAQQPAAAAGPAPASRSPVARRRSSERAAAELDRLGVGTARRRPARPTDTPSAANCP